MQNCINYSVTSRDSIITLGIQTSLSPVPLLWGGKEERTDDISDYIQMKAIEQYYHVLLFIMLYKVVLTFKSVDKTLVSDHSNESY